MPLCFRCPEVVEAPKQMSKRSKEMMREAKSDEHLFIHRPKNPFCKTCVRAKTQAPQARRRHGSSTVDANAFGDHVTADRVISNDETFGFKGEWNALVVKGVFTQFWYFYPSARQDADSCVRAFQHFTKPDDHVGIFYSDNSGEIAAAVKSMDWRHVLSQPYVSQFSGVIEREIRTIREGARANLFQNSRLCRSQESETHSASRYQLPLLWAAHAGSGGAPHGTPPRWSRDQSTVQHPVDSSAAFADLGCVLALKTFSHPV